ncbi:HEAT repeat domain-containing protein [Candidatus Poriferisodalis sp.]|uniref:HEAT repeat domain-containing protein n=1 Tax=Candidatus Poriferisodalis sp. TaxID=3101277 RepID=UPI003C6EB401
MHDVLREPAALADQKSTICIRIASLTDRLPDAERQRLIDSLDDMATAAEGFWPGNRMAGADTVLSVAIDAIALDEAEAAVIRLAHSSDQQRVNAARLLGYGHCPTMQPMLTHMIRDTHPPVRSHAARSIGMIAACTPNPLTETVAQHITEADGRLLPLALLAGLSHDSPPLNHIGEAAAAQLQDHRSAHVRRRARLLLGLRTG